MKRPLVLAAAAAALILLAAAWLVAPAAGVPILAYHKVGDTDEAYSVAPADFERQMAWLAGHGYTAVSLTDLLGHLTAGKALPAKPIVITFDDGYEDNYLTALPIMEKHGMKATVFVITDSVGQAPYMDWDQIRAMRSRGTEMGSHTLAHRVLTDLPPAERLRDARASKEALEWQLNTRIRFLAYPFGKFDPATADAARQAGYLGACSTLTGLNRPGDDVYALKRINIPRSGMGLLEFRLRLLRANVYAKLGL